MLSLDYWFDHEKLNVYQEDIAFCAWWPEVGSACRSIPNIKDQLDRASTSIPLNIAEGNAKQSLRDRCRYLQIAMGSAFECAACLDVLADRGCLSRDTVVQGKRRLRPIGSMLVGLINSINDRVQEPSVDYEVEALTS